MDSKSSKRGKNNSGATAAGAVDTDNVDKIRDILFGNQMREVDKRFDRLEKILSKDIDSLRNDNARQIESLKTFVESELEILAARLASEERARIENDDEIDGLVKAQAKQLDKKIADLAKSLDKSTSDINQKILRQAQDFGDELSRQLGEARERMNEHRDELSAAKVDKLALAEMLNALALQVNADETP